eukprot:244750-Prymnesium_polylepis.1
MLSVNTTRTQSQPAVCCLFAAQACPVVWGRVKCEWMRAYDAYMYAYPVRDGAIEIRVWRQTLISDFE